MSRLNIPLFLETVPAGFPSPAQDYIENTLVPVTTSEENDPSVIAG